MIEYEEKIFYTVGELNKELHFLYSSYETPVKDEFLSLYKLIMKHHNRTYYSPHPSPTYIEQILLSASKNREISYIKFKKGEKGLREYRGYALEDVEEFFNAYYKDKKKFNVLDTTPVVTEYFRKEN